MSRKDYIEIAEIIIDNHFTSSYTEHDTNELARFFANKLKQTNIKFDEPKFRQYIIEAIK